MRKNAGKYVWTNANVIGRGRERERWLEWERDG